MANNTEVKKLYDALLNKGYNSKNIGSEEIFSAKMEDENNRKQLYDYVASRGDFKIGSFADYEKRLTSQAEKQTATYSPTASTRPTEPITPVPNFLEQTAPVGTGILKLEETPEEHNLETTLDEMRKPEDKAFFGAPLKPADVDTPIGERPIEPEQRDALNKGAEQIRNEVSLEESEWAARKAEAQDAITYRVDKQLEIAEQELEELEKKAGDRYEEVKSGQLRELGSMAEDFNMYNAQILADPEYNTLSNTIETKREQIRLLKREGKRQRGEKQSEFVQGVGQGFLEAATSSPKAMVDLAAMLSTPKKDISEGLKEAQELLKETQLANQKTQGQYAENDSSWYQYGQMTGMMPVFVLELMAGNALFGGITVGADLAAKGSAQILKGVAKKAVGVGTKKYLQQVGVKGALKLGADWTVRRFGTFLDGAIKAPLIATSIQGAKVSMNTADIKRGGVVMNDKGELQYENKKSTWDALYQSFSDQSIENLTEMVGAPIIEKITGKVLSVRHLRKAALLFKSPQVTNFLSAADRHQLKGFVAYAQKMFEGMGVHSVPEEIWEEYLGQGFRTIFNLDAAYIENPDGTRTNLFATKDFHKDTFYGMIISMGAMRALPTIGGTAAYCSAEKHLNKANVRAAELFGNDAWETIKRTIDKTENSELHKLSFLIEQGEAGEKKKAAIDEYVERLAYYRGFNLGTLARAKNNPNDPDEPGASPSPAVVQAEQNYAEGYAATDPIEINEARHRRDTKRAELVDRLGDKVVELIEQDSAAAIETLRNNEMQYGAAEIALALDYINVLQYHAGLKQKVQDTVEVQTEAVRAKIQSSINKSTGMLQPATMKTDDRKVYIVSGNIVTFADGTGVDLSNSDKSIIIRDMETGQFEQVSPDAILSLDVAVDPTQAEQAAIMAVREQVARPIANALEGKLSFAVGGQLDAPIAGNIERCAILGVGDNYLRVSYKGNKEEIILIDDVQAYYEQQTSARVRAEEQQQAAERQKVIDVVHAEQKAEDRLNLQLLIARMDELAEEAPEIELTPENWEAQFGGDGKVATPIGEVKMGDNQLAKLFLKKRTAEFGMIMPTLTNPDVVIEKFAPAEKAERDTKYLFIKTFNKPNGGRIVHFESVTVSKDGMEVSISSHEVDASALKKEMQNGKILHLSKKLSIGSDEYLTETRNNERPDLVPSSDNSSSKDKGNDNKQETNGSEENISALSQIPVDEKGQRRYEESAPEVVWDAFVEQSHGDEQVAMSVAMTMQKRKAAQLKKLAAKKLADYAKEKDLDSPDVYFEAERNRKEAIAQAQAELDFWNNVSNEQSRRQRAAEDAQRELNRQAAEERAKEAAKHKAAEAEAEQFEREALNGVPEITLDKADDARRRGYRRWRGMRIDRQKPISALIGKAISVPFSKSVSQKSNLAIIDAKDLQPSHMDGERNPYHFIDEAQPKERKDAASIIAADDIAKAIRPNEIATPVTAYVGTPTINERGEVIQGNNRSAALRLMWESHKEQASKYKEYLIQHASEFGLDAEKIAAMECPVLVNMANVSDEQAIKLGQYKASDLESGGVERIDPKSTMRKIGDEMPYFVERLLAGEEDMSFAELADKNGDEVLRWLSERKYISATQHQSAYDSKGNLTAEAKNDIKGILYQAIFQGGSTSLEEMFNKLPAKAQKAILATAYRDFNSPKSERMIPELQSAIMAFQELMAYRAFRESKNYKEASEAMQEWSMQFAMDDVSGESYLPSEKYSNFALRLAVMFKGETQNTIKDKFNKIFDLIQGTQEETLFDSPDNTPRTLAQAIKEVLQLDYNGQTRSNVLGSDLAASEAGQRRSATNDSSGERTETRKGQTDSGSRVRTDGEGAREESLQRENTGDIRQVRSEEVGSIIGKSLSEEESNHLVSLMEAKAEEAPELELTPENWLKQFGEDSKVETPIGQVKIGENQLAKLFLKKRTKEFGMILPTLTNPDVIIEENSDSINGQAERSSSYLFVKTFIKDGQKIKYYASITVKKEGLEVVISNHYIEKSALEKKLRSDKLIYLDEAILSNSSDKHLTENQNGLPDLLPTQDNNAQSIERDVIWRAPKDATTSSAEKQGLDYDQPNKAETESKGSGITPQNSSSTDKGSKNQEENNIPTEDIAVDSAVVDANPTEAQKRAGNYKKGNINVDGYNITIENPKGSVRSGKDADGTEWSIEMKHDYGYIRGTEGVDGDHIDVYLSDTPTVGNVYVVDQVDQKTGEFDEHKVMYGFSSMEEAVQAYRDQYEYGWKVGTVTEVSRDEFKKWIESSHRKTKPFSEYKCVNTLSYNTTEAKEESTSENTGADGGQKAKDNIKPSLLDVVRTLYENGKEFASKLYQMSFFDVAATPAFMQELGLRGYKFTIRYGVIARHISKDDSHGLSEKDWEQLPQAIQSPFAVTKLKDTDDSYRLYTTLRTERGEYVVVGVDVKNAGRELEVNAISTVFGRRSNANLTQNEEVIYRSKEITPEQSSLLDEPNSHQYPTEQEYSTDKGSNNQQENNTSKTTNTEISDASDEQIEQEIEELAAIEEKWDEAISNYVFEHYPTQATVTSATTSEQGLREREAMRNDPVLKQMREDAKKEYAEKEAQLKAIRGTQGNPIDSKGNLVIEKISSISDLTDADFTNPTRSVELPKLPQNVAEAIGSNGKPVVIKKNIFERNQSQHPDVSAEQSRQILQDALYSTDLYGRSQKGKKPYNWVLIHKKDQNGNNRLVLLEVNHNKENVEIIHWHYVDDAGLNRLKRQAEREGEQILVLPSELDETGALPGRPQGMSNGRQAEREGGQFLILSPQEGSAAALSTLPNDLSSEDKGSKNQGENNSSRKKQTEATERKIDDYGEKIEGARKDALKDLAKTMGDITEQSLVAMSFGKVWKRPNFKKLVESGQLSERDAKFAEAFCDYIEYEKKPTLNARASRWERARKEEKIAKWAKRTKASLDALSIFLAVDESKKIEILNELGSAKPLNGDAETAIAAGIVGNENIKLPENSICGSCLSISPVYAYMQVREKLGLQLGDKLDIKLIITPNSSYSKYNLTKADGSYLYFSKFDTFDEAIDAWAAYVALESGRTDVAIPKSMMGVGWGETEYVKSSEYFYITYPNGKVERSLSRSQADTLAKKWNDNPKHITKVKVEPMVSRQAASYIVLTGNIDGKAIRLSSKKFPTQEDAERAIEENSEALSDALLAENRDRLIKEGKIDANGDKSKDKRPYSLSEDYEFEGAGRNRTCTRTYTWRYYYKALGLSMFQNISPKFYSEGEALKWEEANRTELLEAFEKMKQADKDFSYFASDDNGKNKKDYRGGRDISEKEFADTFGFRGIQFGNWANQSDRQIALNNAYDSFMDLAELLHLTPRALSLAGELGIAFGARGSGGANAHYEPNQVVINLTKTRGAGSLAHEWWHSLDNYFSRAAKMPQGMMTESSITRKLAVESGVVRAEIAQKFASIVDKVEKSTYGKRTSSMGTYWGSSIEQTARLFGAWVSMQMRDNDAHNGFLTYEYNEAKQKEYKQRKYERYKYFEEKAGNTPMSYEEFVKTDKAIVGYVLPVRAELEELSGVVRDLFDTMQERIGEHGETILYEFTDERIEELTDQQKETTDVILDLIADAGIEVSMDEQEMREVYEASERLGEIQKETLETASSSQAKYQQTVVSSAAGAKVLNNLKKAANTIREWLKNGTRNKSFEIELPQYVLNKVRAEMGRNFDTHNITSNGIIHGLKGHGVGGDKLSDRSIPIREEDAALIPYIMTAPDMVVKGSTKNGRESVRFIKNISNGYIVVVEKEFDNSADDLETINIWAELSNVSNAQRTLNRTSETPTIGRSDIAKIQQDAEKAIAQDKLMQFMTVFHGSGTSFERFDHSYMGTGEGAQAYGCGTYATEVNGIARSYAELIPWKKRDNIAEKIQNLGELIARLRREISQMEEFAEQHEADIPSEGKLRIQSKISEKRATLEQRIIERQELIESDSRVGNSNIYTVEIPENNGENYLSWNQKYGVKEIKELYARLKPVMNSTDFDDFFEKVETDDDYRITRELSGRVLYHRLESATGSDELASKALSQAGYTGIEYPAQYQTGGRTDRAKNYVIFKESDLKITDHIQFLKTAKGEALGFVKGGKIYLDPKQLNPNTPIHEYTHLWDMALQKANPELWKRGIELMKQLPLWDEIKNNPAYADIAGDENLLASEVHARLTGKDGAALMEQMIAEVKGKDVFTQADRISLINSLREWIKQAWQWVKDTMAAWTNEEASKVSLEEFINMPIKDLVEGKKLNDYIYNTNAPTQYSIRTKPTPNSADKVLEVFNDVVNNNTTDRKPIRIGTLTTDGLEYLRRLTGWNFKNSTSFVLNASDLKHIYNNHFGENEKDKGNNIPLTENDIRSIVDVISHPDDIVFFEDEKRNGRKTMYFLKADSNGTYNLCEVISSKRGTLTAKTLYKTKRAATQRVMDLKQSLLPTSETYFGASSLVDAKIPQLFDITITTNEDYRNNDASDREYLDAVNRGDTRYRSGDNSQANTATIEQKTLHANELVKKLNLSNVEIVTDVSTLQGKRAKAKGFYEKSSGKITIVVPNNTSLADIEQTLLHEAVGHYGLRRLFGEHFDAFLENVFNSVDVSIREKIVSLMSKHNWNAYTATEEYLAGLAERTYFANIQKQSWWKKVKELFHEMLSKLGFRGFKSIPMTDNDLRYILWRSYENLKGNKTSSVFSEANDIAMQYELNVGEYAYREPNGLEDINAQFNEHLQQFSDSTADITVFNLGRPSNILISAGVKNLPMRLYGSKVLSKMKKHGFGASELRDLPNAVANPIAVFNNYNTLNNRSILTELTTSQGNFLVSLSVGKGNDLDFNIVSSLFGKTSNKIVDWINKGFATYINKEKALNYLHLSAPIAEASNNQELSSATKVVESFENPKLDNEILFRMPNEQEPPMSKRQAREQYETIIRSGRYQAIEAMQDSMRALLEAMKIIGFGEDIERIEDVPIFQNAYLGENQLSSVNRAEMDALRATLITPLLDAINAITNGKTDAYNQLINYMFAKHGLERNSYMARRDAKQQYERYLAKHSNTSMTEDDFFFKNRNHDYAGLTALTEENDVKDAEAIAQRLVNDYEHNHNTSDLWDKTKALSDAILSKSFESGLISKEQYEKIKAMYQYYIPLRGFEEETAEDAYAYLTYARGNFNKGVRQAYGRKSKADDPIANLMSMAMSTIAQGNRNVMVKQRFLNYVLARPSDLVSINDLWLKYNELTEEWEAQFPELNEKDTPEQIAEKIRAFEEKMQQLATDNPDIYKSGKMAEGIPYKVLSKNGKNEHQIIVKRNGRDIVLTINGNPRLAHAINGLSNPDSTSRSPLEAVVENIGMLNRFLANTYTTWQPNFLVSNRFRDAWYANSFVWVKETPNYAIRYNGNFIKCNLVTMKTLFNKYRKGLLDNSNEMHVLFKEFISNGGETGYSAMLSLDSYKKEVSKWLRGHSNIKLAQVKDGLLANLNDIGRAVETSARFAAYITSREFGRSIGRAIHDAKEISVNFNKKGAGSKYFGTEGQTLIGDMSAFVSGTGRAGFAFWNAAIQGTIGNYIKYGTRNKFKFTSSMATLLALGFLATLLASGGGDDDDDAVVDNYYNFPPYMRRSNFMFKLSDGTWIKIPLPIEFRPLYGLGELFGSAVHNGEQIKTIEVVELFAQLSPVDFMQGQLEGKPFNPNVLVPTSLRPFADIAANKSWTGLPIYRDSEFNKYMPAWTKAYKSTNSALVNLAVVLNDATGGDDFKQGKVDLNPATIEYFLKSYVPFWTQVNEISNSINVFTGEKEFDWRYIPLANRLLASDNDRTQGRDINEEYYRIVEECEQTQHLLNGYTSANKEGVLEYAKKLDFLYNSPEFARLMVYKSFDKAINNLRKQAEMMEDEEDRRDLQEAEYQLKAELIEEIEALSASEKR